MKDNITFRQSSRLGHTRAFFDIFKYLSDKAVGDRGTDIFGSKPQVADYTPTDAGVEAGRAVTSNVGNIDNILALLEKINPGYIEQLKQGGKNTMSLLKGEIPQDVQDSLSRTAAYKAFQGGYGGSGMSKALKARDFGRTSLDLMSEGTNSAQRWQQIAEGATSPFIVTAPQQIAVTGQNNLYKQATDQFKYNVEAAPNPEAAGKFNLQVGLGAMAASFGMGSAMGGMGGGAAKAGGGSSSGLSSGASSAGSAYNYSPYSNYGPWASGYQWGG